MQLTYPQWGPETNRLLHTAQSYKRIIRVRGGGGGFTPNLLLRGGAYDPHAFTPDGASKGHTCQQNPAACMPYQPCEASCKAVICSSTH